MEELLKQRLTENHEKIALIASGTSYSYDLLLKTSLDKLHKFKRAGLGSSSLVVLLGDFSFNSITSLLACILAKSTIIPLTLTAQSNLKIQIDLLNPDFLINSSDGKDLIKTLLDQPRTKTDWWNVIPKDEAGLIVFTSGSTGNPKAILHSIDSLCYRYLEPKPPMISICFLKFDHMGGINTILALLFRGATAVITSSLQPEIICSSIAKYKVELLPTTPSFLTQLLISQAIKKYDLSSLKVISYGTEVMNENILIRLNSELPLCKFKQTYGLSETGVFQIKSKSNESLWFKFIDSGISYKVIDGILWIKTKSNLLAKLVFENNEISKIEQKDDWFCTDDVVDVDGDYLKIKSRSTDLINVGGLKVYPSEVENCILQLNFVNDVTVLGKKNLLLGQIVTANVQIEQGYDKELAMKNIKKHCLKILERFKVPSVIFFSDKHFVNDRFKKVRQY